MIDNVNLAKKLGYLEMPDDCVVSLDDALSLPDHKLVILCTGSQGEPTAILGRLSTGKYSAFSIKEGDTVVLSSHPIPGNEEQVSLIINRLKDIEEYPIWEVESIVETTDRKSVV